GAAGRRGSARSWERFWRSAQERSTEQSGPAGRGQGGGKGTAQQGHGKRERSGHQGANCPSGPASSGKFVVFRTWMPALCSPLKGVCPAEHWAAAASSNASNHIPRRNVWMGGDTGLVPPSLA